MLLAVASDPLAILLLALVVDLAFGDMAPVFRFIPHPVVVIGRGVTFFDRRLNRESRGDIARQIRGTVAVILLVGIAAAVGWLVKEYLAFVHYAWAIEALIVAVLLAQRSLFEHVAAVGKALQTQGLDGARKEVAKIVGRDPESLDEFGIARAAIESLFENFSDGVIAPAFWYLLLGLPGLFAYKTASALDSMIGHRSPRYLYFGWAAARFDDVLNWIPARLTAALICLAALFMPGAHSGEALRTALADAKKHRSPNAGWPEAGSVWRCGPRHYADTVINAPWLGEGRARVTVADIGEALKLYTASAACLFALLSIAAAARYFYVP